MIHQTISDPQTAEKMWNHSMNTSNQVVSHWLTGNDVTADDLPSQSGQRLGHHCDDAAARGFDVGGPTAGSWYSGANAGADSGPRIGGLCRYIQKSSVTI